MIPLLECFTSSIRPGGDLNQVQNDELWTRLLQCGYYIDSENFFVWLNALLNLGVAVNQKTANGAGLAMTSTEFQTLMPWDRLIRSITLQQIFHAGHANLFANAAWAPQSATDVCNAFQAAYGDANTAAKKVGLAYVAFAFTKLQSGVQGETLADTLEGILIGPAQFFLTYCYTQRDHTAQPRDNEVCRFIQSLSAPSTTPEVEVEPLSLRKRWERVLDLIGAYDRRSLAFAHLAIGAIALAALFCTISYLRATKADLDPFRSRASELETRFTHDAEEKSSGPQEIERPRKSLSILKPDFAASPPPGPDAKEFFVKPSEAMQDSQRLKEPLMEALAPN